MIIKDASEYLKELFLLEKNINLDILIKLKEIDCYIAGGALTSVFSGTKINDYDIYFKDILEYKKLRTVFDSLKKANGSLYSPEVETEHVVSYKIDNIIFQLIKFDEMFNVVEYLLAKFDFRVCMAAFSFKEKKFYIDENFLHDLAKKELVYNIGDFPIATLFRLRKFLYKGFKISGCNIIKLALRVNNIEIKTYKQLKRQLIGIDTVFLKDLLNDLEDEQYKEKQYDFALFLRMIDQYIQRNYAKVLEEENNG